MEEVICKASNNIHNSAVDLNTDKEVCLDSNTILASKNLTNETDGNLYTTEETQIGVNGHGNGTETLCEPQIIPDSIIQKASPTLIESAIQVMKNLFSPEKVKSKSPSVLSPINKQRIDSGSPSSSTYIPGKSDVFSSEPGKEIVNDVQIPMTENNVKIHLLPELGGTSSPLNFETQNNTDESFLTTVSLIDDSFHSTVTHIDEHGEALKNGTSLLGSVLNNSQNLDMVDSLSDTLENDSYLDNTTLKIGNLSFQNGSVENLNENQGNSFIKNNNQNHSGKTEEINSIEKKINGNDGGGESESPSSNGVDKIEEKNLGGNDILTEVLQKESEFELENTNDEKVEIVLSGSDERILEKISGDNEPFPREKKSMSEGNSPVSRTNLSKVNFNKSDEIINSRIFREEMKEIEKSSVDMSWRKNTEVSEVSKESGVNQTHEYKSEQIELSSNNSYPVPVISQQSYTILCCDNKLNRPVIDENSEKQSSFQDETFSTKNARNSMGRNSANTSFGGEVKSTQLKQSTPLWEGNNDGLQKFFRPTTLQLNSPEIENSGDEKVVEDGLKDSTTQIFYSNKTPESGVEISPVNPVNDLKCLYINQLSNSVTKEKEDLPFNVDSGSTTTSHSFLKNEKEVKSSGDVSETHKLNQTFDKKELLKAHLQKNAASPNSDSELALHNMNQTFDKSSASAKNLTFTKTQDSKKKNETFYLSGSPDLSQLNRTYDKPQLNETFNKEFDKGHLANKTLEGIATNQTFTTVADLDNFPEQKLEKLNMSADGNTNQNVSSEKSDGLSSAKSSDSSILSTFPLLDVESNENQNIDDLSKSLTKMDLEGNFALNQIGDIKLDGSDSTLSDGISVDSQPEDKFLNSLKNEKVRCDPDLVQLIQEQFSPNDIEKICNVVQDMSSLKLSNDILRASEQFDKSFHGNFSDAEFKPPEMVLKTENPPNPLSPQGFEFLNSIRGKPTGRDLSRESLYVKFDPLVQPSANSLIDFTKEGEALPPIEASPPNPHNSSICEQLLDISPQKKSDAIVPPLTPLSSKTKRDSDEDKLEKLKELQNEIYFLKNLYSERERTNRAKMDDYESQITKLTGDRCFLEDKLKESNEREKSLVKKVKEQNQNINQLTVIMEEYVKVISKLTAELEALKNENTKQIESLSLEKDSYMTHLQNTEAAFTDVHTKYEKSKKTIVSLKANEVLYRNTIAEQAQKLEDFKAKAKEAQEKAMAEFQKIQEDLTEAKSNHTQESARLRAQLRKTELKVEALQESLDQKIKENQQLTAICDELIEGKK